MKVITLCGSTKFEDKYHEINAKLTLEGNVVFSCGIFKYKDGGKETKRDLLQAVHRKKIDTAEEIEYAKRTGKKITYLESKQKLECIECGKSINIHDEVYDGKCFECRSKIN